MLETRAKTVVTLASTLRPCEVGKWTLGCDFQAGDRANT